MKTKLFTLLLAVAASVGTMFAEPVQIGDLYYNLDATSQTAEVTHQNSDYPYWSTTITTAIIPASVTYNSVTYSVTSIGYMAFSGCTGLTSVTIPNSVTSIGEAAFAFTGLTSVTIPNSVTSIGDDAFVACSGLTSINVASDNPNYCSVNGVLFNKNQTTLISYPGGKQGVYTIPNSVTSIGESAFSDCYGLTSVTIPNSVTSIGEYAFQVCSGLTSVTIPNSVTSIGDHAFSHCDGLTSVTIGNSVTSIGDEAFRGCSGLTSVTCLATTPPMMGSNVFYNVNRSQIPLYVPAGSVSAYKSADQWKDFTNILPISQQGVEEVLSNQVPSTKVLHNGQILILRGDRTYTLTGQEVR